MVLHKINFGSAKSKVIPGEKVKASIICEPEFGHLTRRENEHRECTCKKTSFELRLTVARAVNHLWK